MSTNHTPNYNLSQWEKTDKVLMEDFNADNAKVDAAIAGRLGEIEIIQEFVLEGSPNLDLGSYKHDMTDFDWGAWSVVGIVLWRVLDTSSTGRNYISLTGCSDLRGPLNGGLAMRTPGPMMAVLFPLHDPTRKVAAMGFPGGDVAWSKDFCYTDITAFQFNGSTAHIPSNSRVVLFGLR